MNDDAPESAERKSTDDESSKLESKLTEKYFLVKKRDWYWWLGGAGAFVVAFLALSYKTTLEVLSSDIAANSSERSR